MPTIRPAQTADLAALAALDLRCNPSPWAAAHFQAALISAHDTVLLAQKDGGMVGLIVWQQVLDEAELHLIATAPECRRQGIASRLLQAMFAQTAAEGAVRIFLEVRAGNDAALALYAAHGFARTAVRKNYYGDEDAVLMEKLC